jgi:carboxypeptidase Q
MQRMQDRGQRIFLELNMEAHQEADVPSRNVIIQVRGVEKPDEYVVIGGHMDSWDIAEGAIDDGAGAVSSWEAVRLIHKLGLKPRRTIRAVMFVNGQRVSNALILQRRMALAGAVNISPITFWR